MVKILRAVPLEAAHEGGEVIDVQLADLFIDMSYQRPPLPAHVAKLALDWDPFAAMLLAVNLREDNTIALIDGQHRMLAMQRRGIASWRAYAWTGLTIPEEARLFLRLNKDRRHHMAIGRWKAELCGENPLIAALDRIIAECGYHLGNEGKARDVYAISCPDRLVTIATGKKRAQPDPERVRRVLTFLRACWDGDPIGAREAVVGGIDLFLGKYGGRIRVRDVQQKFRTVPLSSILLEANRVQVASVPKKDIRTCVCIALQRAYDRGRRHGPDRLEKDTGD